MMVLSEEDKILIENICKGYSARQLISATRASLSTACARCRSDISSTVGQVSSTDIQHL